MLFRGTCRAACGRGDVDEGQRARQPSLASDHGRLTTLIMVDTIGRIENEDCLRAKVFALGRGYGNQD